MFKCFNNHVFEEPKRGIELHGDYYAEPTECCPVCGEDFEDAEKCQGCGEWFTRSEDFYHGWCYGCARQDMDETYDDVTDWIDYLNRKGR